MNEEPQMTLMTRIKKSNELLGPSVKRVKHKRKWKRWVGISAYFDLSNLTSVARNEGMKVIVAYKPGFFFFYHIGLYGTSDAMRNTESKWKQMDAEAQIENREPKGCLSIDVNVPRCDWIDNGE
jgi:hypothetical protein